MQKVFLYGPSGFAYKANMAGSDNSSWHCLLELKLRKTAGTAFQTFFSDVMEVLHSDEFVRTKPQGSKGDLGCDGYLISTGEVFACYGAQNGAAGSLSFLVAKMKEDFEKAKASLSKIMKTWVMTHNLIEGMPTDALKVFEALKAEHPQFDFAMCGPQRIRAMFSQLSEDQRAYFLGPNARNSDFLHLQIGEVKELVDAIMKAVDSNPIPTSPILPVSPQKLTHNAISPSWAVMIHNGRFNAHYIDIYFESHHHALRGEQVAQVFRDRYLDLKAQKLNPDTIMMELFEFIAGPEKPSVERQVAAYSLLAYLFESCDIFENAPGATAAS